MDPEEDIAEEPPEDEVPPAPALPEDLQGESPEGLANDPIEDEGDD